MTALRISTLVMTALVLVAQIATLLTMKRIFKAWQAVTEMLRKRIERLEREHNS